MHLGEFCDTNSECYVVRRKTLGRQDILSKELCRKILVESFLSKSILSTEHFVDKTFCRKIFVEKHLVDRSLRRQITSSKSIWSTDHFVDGMFCQKINMFFFSFSHR